MSPDRLRLRDIRSTTPFRLSLLLGSLFLCGIILALVLGYALTARELTARSDRLLQTRADSLLRTPASALPARIRTEIANAPGGFSYFALIGQDGELVAGNIQPGSGVPTGRPFSIAALAGAHGGAHGPLRVLRVRTADGEIIVLGRDISQIHDLRRRLLSILLASGAISILSTLATALLLSTAPLRRVRDLERASRAIAAGDLTVRMPIAGRHDELDQFAATVNLMVEEVAHVVAQVKTATDAIAHDLRTPLTRVRASLHRARQSEGLVGEPAALIASAIADLDLASERFAALLRIAELEASQRRAGLARLDLAPLLLELVELYEPLAEEAGRVLAVEASMLWVEADRGLLFEAIGNLIDNAIKFTRTRVTVRGRDDGGVPLVEIMDDGPGIPPDERGAMIRRFHRAQGASGVEGSGLGLAVVHAIAHLHGIALEFDDAKPGLVARLRFERAWPE